MTGMLRCTRLADAKDEERVMRRFGLIVVLERTA